MAETVTETTPWLERQGTHRQASALAEDGLRGQVDHIVELLCAGQCGEVGSHGEDHLTCGRIYRRHSPYRLQPTSSIELCETL